MSASWWGRASPRTATTSSASTRTSRRSRRSNAGKMPIYEPGLEEIVRRNHAEERLTFTTDLPTAVRASEIVFIAVGTPQGEDGSADLQHVLAVARDVGRAMNEVHGHRRQEHRAGRHGDEGARGDRARRRRSRSASSATRSS